MRTYPLSNFIPSTSLNSSISRRTQDSFWKHGDFLYFGTKMIEMFSVAERKISWIIYTRSNLNLQQLNVILSASNELSFVVER